MKFIAIAISIGVMIACGFLFTSDFFVNSNLEAKLLVISGLAVLSLILLWISTILVKNINKKNLSK